MSAGKPDDWSQKLWDAYKECGRTDKGFVASCNRFLDQMLEHRLSETLNLVWDLKRHMVINENELDIYRHWYSKNIKWPEECLCDRENVVIGLERRWRTHPGFLTACIQLARRALSGDIPMDFDIYASRAYEADEPIDEDETFIITANRKLEAYLTSGAWRIDDAPMEDLKDVFGTGFSVGRKPDESRRDYINRVKDRLDDRLIMAMERATEIALPPKAPRRKTLDPENKHEKMLVLRMFGTPMPDIIEACRDSLSDRADARRTVYDRTKLVAKYLGFLPPSGGERR